MPHEKKKILIADSSPELMREILHSPQAAKYHLEIATSGSECLGKIESFQPHLLFLDLFLPEMHGIEILRKLKRYPQTASIGVIMTSDYVLKQSYTAAISQGAIYFLNKPFPLQRAFELIDRFFQGNLTPDPYTENKIPQGKEHACYHPKLHEPNHYIRFWGTRGSIAVSGPEYLRYGGNSSCLEVHYDDDLIIIDAGTGIRALGSAISSFFPSKKFHLIVSHTHWDHLTGFPFFQPIYEPDRTLTLWAPVGFEKDTPDIFSEILTYAYFPIRLDDIQAKISFQPLREGVVLKIGKIEIFTHYAFHPGSTLCFKIRAGNKTFGYVTDNEFLAGYHGHPNAIELSSPLLRPYLSLIEFFKGCDFLIHEAQYLPEQYMEKVGWGHSSVSNVAVLIKFANIKEWIVTHHDPEHTDEALQKKYQLHKDILEECGIACTVRFAFDGLVYPL